MFDLHVHTTASDGTLSPVELISLAKKIGLEGIGITDHDTISGLEESYKAAALENIIVVPGVELSCYWSGEEVHILGYFVDFTSGALQEKLKYLQQKRKDRINEMIIKANKYGYKMSASDVEEISKGEAIGRPHLAQALVKKGYVSSVKEGFANLLTKGKPLYVPRAKLSPVEAIDLIYQSGGVPVLAHPGLYKFNWQSFLPQLIDAGLVGIEVHYPHHSDAITNLLQKIAKEFCLIATGGSDFHGEHMKENMLGVVGVDKETINQLKERRKDVITS